MVEVADCTPSTSTIHTLGITLFRCINTKYIYRSSSSIHILHHNSYTLLKPCPASQCGERGVKEAGAQAPETRSPPIEES
jgi:hypothetical protein